MVLLIFFISLCIGLYARYHIALCAIISIIWLFFIFKRTNKKLFLICLLIIGIGVGISFINITYTTKEVFKGIIYKTSDNYFLFNSGGEKLYVYSKNHSYNIGDIVTIKGYKSALSFTKLESSFDFKKYLNDKGVFSSLEIKEINVNFKTPLKINNMKASFYRHLDDKSKSLISAILFSDNDYSELNKYISFLHINRFLSSSGIYLHFFLSFITYLLSIKLTNKTSEILSIICLFPYLICVFPKFSILKIIFLTIIRWINKYKLDNKFSYFTLLSFTGIVFLLLNYHLVYSDSFILGYLIPIVSYFANSITSSWKKIKRKLITPLFVMGIFIVYEAKFYNSICPLSNILNYLLTPIFLFYSFVGLLCFYKVPLYGGLQKLTNLISKLIHCIKIININIACPKFNDFIAVFLILGLFAFMYYFSIGFKPIFISIISVLGFVISINCVPIKNFISEQVSFINVGQGDSCLVRKGTTSILIDTGGSLYTDIANDCLIPYFHKNRIYNIDYVITTHDDYDHKGALEELTKNFHVKEYIYDKSFFPLNINDIHITNYNNHIDSVNDKNDNSLVLGFNLCNKDFLIMGDAPIQIEKKIITEYKYVPCDVLKIGHHGSSTSTCKEFINYLKPEEAIVSVGKNYYGHPNKSVLDILKKANVEIKRTDKMGTITYSNYIFM